MKYILEIILLFGPATGYALWNGRNGLVHPSYDQVKTVALIMIVCVTLARFHALYYGVSPFVETVSGVLWWYLKAFLVAITGFGLLFPLAFNWMWHNNNSFPKEFRWKYVVNHLSPTAWPDKFFLKYRIHYLVRLAIYLTLFIGSVIWFVL